MSFLQDWKLFEDLFKCFLAWLYLSFLNPLLPAFTLSFLGFKPAFSFHSYAFVFVFSCTLQYIIILFSLKYFFSKYISWATTGSSAHNLHICINYKFVLWCVFQNFPVMLSQGDNFCHPLLKFHLGVLLLVCFANSLIFFSCFFFPFLACGISLFFFLYCSGCNFAVKNSCDVSQTLLSQVLLELRLKDFLLVLWLKHFHLLAGSNFFNHSFQLSFIFRSRHRMYIWFWSVCPFEVPGWLQNQAWSICSWRLWHDQDWRRLCHPTILKRFI